MGPEEIKRLINLEAQILFNVKVCDVLVENGDEVAPLFQSFLQGNFLSVLEATPSVFFSAGSSREAVAEQVAQYLDKEGEGGLDKHGKQLQVLVCSAAFLSAWLQMNTTGPLDANVQEWCEKTCGQFKREDLSLDGEIPHAHVVCGFLLSCAAAFLLDNRKALSRTLTASWWAGRAAMAYQQVFSEPVPSLKDNCIGSYQHAFECFDQSGHEHDKRMRAVLLVETGHAILYYGDDRKAFEYFEKAQAATGLQMSLTGIMGVRTRFQTFKTPQLVLDAKSEAVQETPITDGAEEKQSIPRLVQLEDDTLLKSGPKVDRNDEYTEGNIDVVDQCTILAQCAYYVNSFSSEDYEAGEKLEAMVRRVEKNPNNWIVHSTALREKCRVEYKRYKTKERAVLQYQVLVDQFFDEDPLALERLGFVFAVAYLPRFGMRTKLADLMVNLGIAASALNIYEDLKDWDGVVSCYQIMGKDAKAEEVVRDLLSDEKTETPNLWCTLGDLTRDDRCYETAWEMSKGRNSRAMRSLAYSAFRRKEYENCVSYAERALRINPLYPRMWFTSACASMRLEKWEQAAHGFVRVITQNAEDAESWSNLATVYIRMGKKVEAYAALKEALKAEGENWKMWENFLVVCIDLTHYREACHAYQRLCDLVKDGYVDYSVLTMLARVAHDIDDDNLRKSILEVFGRLTSMKSNDAEVWHIYARLHYNLVNKDKARDCLVKRYRSLQKAGWESSDALMQEVCHGCMELFGAYKDEGSESSLHSAKLMLRALAKRIDKLYVVDPLPEVCQEVVDAAAEFQ